MLFIIWYKLYKSSVLTVAYGYYTVVGMNETVSEYPGNDTLLIIHRTAAAVLHGRLTN